MNSYGSRSSRSSRSTKAPYPNTFVAGDNLAKLTYAQNKADAEVTKAILEGSSGTGSVPYQYGTAGGWGGLFSTPTPVAQTGTLPSWYQDTSATTTTSTGGAINYSQDDLDFLAGFGVTYDNGVGGGYGY